MQSHTFFFGSVSGCVILIISARSCHVSLGSCGAVVYPRILIGYIVISDGSALAVTGDGNFINVNIHVFNAIGNFGECVELFESVICRVVYGFRIALYCLYGKGYLARLALIFVRRRCRKFYCTVKNLDCSVLQRFPCGYSHAGVVAYRYCKCAEQAVVFACNHSRSVLYFYRAFILYRDVEGNFVTRRYVCKRYFVAVIISRSSVGKACYITAHYRAFRRNLFGRRCI